MKKSTHRRRGPAAVLAALAITAILAACAGGGSPGMNQAALYYDGASTSSAEAATEAAFELDYGAESTLEEPAWDTAEKVLSADMEPARNSAARSVEEPVPESPGGVEAVPESPGGVEAVPVAADRKIITTVTLDMESKEYDSTVHRIEAAIEAAGGYIEYSDISGGITAPGVNGLAAGAAPEIRPLGADYIAESPAYRSGDRRHLYLRIRVPQAGLDGFLAEVEASGNLLTKQENAEDVTLRYVDTESRKKALLVEQEKLLELLAQAESVESVIALQQRLTEVRYALESAESQLRAMDNQVSYATVNLTLNEVIVYSEPPIQHPTAGERIRIGLARTIAEIRGWWVDQFVWVAVNSIYIGAVAVCAVVALLLLRRYLRRRPKPPAQAVAGAVAAPEAGGEGAASDADSGGPGPAVPGGTPIRRTDRLRTWFDGLFRLPFRRLDRLIKYATIAHGVTALAGYLFDALDVYDYFFLVQYVLMFAMLLCALIHMLSYATIPLTIYALVRRWNTLRREPSGEPPAFRGAGTVGLIALQLLLALMGWSIWAYILL